MKITFERMVNVIAPGVIGHAEVRHVVVSEQEAAFSMLRASINARRAGSVGVRAGRYAQLFVNGALVMSDTQMEQDSNHDAIYRARGDVLIGGLGLGLIVLPMLAKSSVQSVTIIEQSADVIALIEPAITKYCADVLQKPSLATEKLAIHRGDVFTWIRRARYDFIYMDIWANICHDNLQDIRTLHRKYRGWLRRGGTVRSWMQEELSS